MSNLRVQLYNEKSKTKILREYFYSTLDGFLLEPGSPFVEKFEKILRSLQESALTVAQSHDRSNLSVSDSIWVSKFPILRQDRRFVFRTFYLKLSDTPEDREFSMEFPDTQAGLEVCFLFLLPQDFRYLWGSGILFWIPRYSGGIEDLFFYQLLKVSNSSEGSDIYFQDFFPILKQHRKISLQINFPYMKIPYPIRHVVHF